MEVDTGAAVSIINKHVWRKIKCPKLNDTKLKSKDYSGKCLNILGQCFVTIEYHSQRIRNKIIVIDGNGPSLLGRNWLYDIKLNWNEIFLHKIHDNDNMTLNNVFKQY